VAQRFSTATKETSGGVSATKRALSYHSVCLNLTAGVLPLADFFSTGKQLIPMQAIRYLSQKFGQGTIGSLRSHLINILSTPAVLTLVSFSSGQKLVNGSDVSQKA
jgi:hypothetical protein